MFAKITMAAAILLPIVGVFGEEFKWPAPPSGYNKDADNIPKGTVTVSIKYPTRNHKDRPVRIYTPPGYSKDRAEKYPVLYLHHGIGGNENAWTSGSEGNADKVMNYLYAQTNIKVTPMIVVMPFGNIDGNWENYEDVLLKDLIPYIEKNYNGSSDPNMRAMAGLSWGGGQTLTYAYRHLDVFTWIGGFSPAPNAGSPSGNIKDIPGVKTKVHLNYFAGGNKSGGPGFDETGFLTTARNYHNFLVQNGVTKVILQEENGLAHEAENWNRQLHHFAQRIFKLETTGIKLQMQAGAFKSGAQSKTFNLSASGTMSVIAGNGMKSAPSFSINGREVRMIGIPTGK